MLGVKASHELVPANVSKNASVCGHSSGSLLIASMVGIVIAEVAGFGDPDVLPYSI